MDDIAEIFSRVTKKKTPGKQGAGAAKLPSTGASTNPLPKHEQASSSTNATKSRKRKRNSKHGEDTAANEDGASADEDFDVDFFASLDRSKQAKEAAEKAGAAAAAAPTSTADRPSKKERRAAKKAKALLDEDECRQILRSHRLKLTLLSDKKAAAPIAPTKVEKTKKKTSKKSSKKEAEEEAAAAPAAAKSAKDDKKQLFPQPLTSFLQLRHLYNISPRLADNLERQLYRLPTEVQMASLPLQLDPALSLSKTTVAADDEGQTILGGSRVDFMAVAPTGSGKTLSFLVPAINSVLKRRADEKAEGQESSSSSSKKKDHILDTVVVAPTRELVHQIANEGKKLAVGLGVRVVAMRKGMQVQAESTEDDDDDDDDEEEEEEGQEDEDQVDEEEEDDEEGSVSDSDGDGDDDGKVKKPKKKTSAAAPVTKADILVTTPQMLLNVLAAQAGSGSGDDSSGRKKALPTVRTLVLDEADVLLDSLFREQTLGLWSACTHPALRVTFWSATMGSNIESLVAEELEKRRGRGRRRSPPADENTPPSASPADAGHPLVRLVVGLKDTVVPNVKHHLIYTANESGKLYAMHQLLHAPSCKALLASSQGEAAADSNNNNKNNNKKDVAPLRPPFVVFTQTAERAAALRDELKADIPAMAGGADRIGVLHAAMSDSARALVMRRFRAAEVWVLITSDLLSRGMHVAGVNGVVNYDVPGSAAAYVHRAGRTGRVGREGGQVVTLYTQEDLPLLKIVANVILASEKQGGRSDLAGGVPPWLLDTLPDVSKEDKKRLKMRGVESRRSVATKSKAKGSDEKGSTTTTTTTNAKARITSKSAWERRKEHNRRDAIASSKRRKLEAAVQSGVDDEEEWGGFD